MSEHNPPQIPKLSKRQLEVLNYLGAGMQYKKIGFKLGISENTVAFHVSEIKRKLGCDNSRKILAYAFHYGLVDQGIMYPDP